jgi:YD repeat-containing protein
VVTYCYDAVGFSRRGLVTTTIYDPAGNVLSVTADPGRTTTHSYDGRGRRDGGPDDGAGPVAAGPGA